MPNQGNTGAKGTPGGARPGMEKNSNLSPEAKSAKTGQSLGGARKRPGAAAKTKGTSWGGY